MIKTMQHMNTFGVRFKCDVCGEGRFITNVFDNEEDAIEAMEHVKLIHDLDCEGMK
jgi:hypothetical protein